MRDDLLLRRIDQRTHMMVGQLASLDGKPRRRTAGSTPLLLSIAVVAYLGTLAALWTWRAIS